MHVCMYDNLEQMMPLSEREKTIIATTITGYISNISVESPEDFLPLTRALQSLLVPQLEDPIDTELRDRVTLIHDYMEPWFGAVVPENREEFISLCKAIILNRIEYFANLSNTEKLSYINDQTNYRQQVNESQTRMSRASPPEVGSEAHVISDQAMLREMQDRFIVEIGATTTRNFLLSNWPVLRDPIQTPIFHSQSRHLLFASEPPRRTEPVNFGNWTRSSDTWECGYDSTPHERAPHRNRERTYTNNSIQYIDSIYISGYTDGHYCIGMKSNWDSSVVQRFKEALNHNGINQTTSGVAVFPSASAPMLILRVTTETIHDVLENVFRAIDALEGEHSVDEAMKSEIAQSLQQFISPIPRI
jgi:hypothetical protein